MNENTTYSIKIFNKMLTGSIDIPYKGVKYILYQYLIIWGCITREIMGLLLQLSYNMLNSSHPDKMPYVLSSKALNDFISYQLKTGNIRREAVKETNLYSLTSKGVQELTTFHEKNMGVPDEYIYLLKHFLIRNNNYSLHSANVSLIFLQLAFSEHTNIASFGLNTPVSADGELLAASFNQSRNHFKADAHLICSSPLPINIFFENDMGTEQQGAVIDKLNRYYALAFSNKSVLSEMCVHFTIGKYSGLNADASACAYSMPGKYTLEQYKNMLDTMVCTASYFLENPEHEKMVSCCPETIISCGESFLEKCGFCSNALENMISYFKKMYALLPDTEDIRRFLSPDYLPQISYRQPGIDMNKHDNAYLHRREKIFKWAEETNITELILKGLRFTASDNNCDGTDFFRCYPYLRRDFEKTYLEAIYQYRQNSSDLSKFTDKEKGTNNENLLNIRGYDNPVDECSSLNYQYENIHFFEYPDGYFPLANCCRAEVNGREALFCFEYISDDYSARIRVENYLKLGAPRIRNLMLYICFDDDIFSLKYIDTLQSLYFNKSDIDTVTYFHLH